MAEPYTLKIADILRDEFRRELALKGKIATRDTWNSIETIVRSTVSKDVVDVMGGVGWRHIEVGKRANTKLPVRKNGDKWELLEPLKRWKDTMAPNIPQFPFARAIAKRARAGIPLTTPAFDRAFPKVGEAFIDGFARGLLKSVKV